jgi:putative ABC transport system ATP-binding protein
MPSRRPSGPSALRRRSSGSGWQRRRGSRLTSSPAGSSSGSRSTEPAVVLADEPTGNLDSATGQAIARLLLEAAGERDAAVVLVTHDPAVSAHADRVVALHSGRIGDERRRVA